MAKSKRGRGDGGIEVLPSGLFRARVNAGIDPATGKRTRLSRTFQNVIDARKWLRQRHAEKDRAGVVAVSADTLADWAAVWVAGKKDSQAAATWAGYKKHLDKHVVPHLGAAKLRDLTPAALSKWSAALAAAGVSPGQRRKVMTTLSACLNAAAVAGKIPANPLRARGGVARPRAKVREAEGYSAADARKIVAAAAGEPWEPLVLLLLDSGVRTGEALALAWRDFDAAAGTVRVRGSLQEVPGLPLEVKPPKTTAGLRTVAVGPATVAGLLAHKARAATAGRAADADTVFPRADGGFTSKSTLAPHWRRIVARAGVPYLRMYAMRHTSASLLVGAGVSVKAVSARLGHESIEITLKYYAHLMPGGDELAAAVLAGILHPGGAAQ